MSILSAIMSWKIANASRVARDTSPAKAAAPRRLNCASESVKIPSGTVAERHGTYYSLHVACFIISVLFSLLPIHLSPSTCLSSRLSFLTINVVRRPFAGLFLASGSGASLRNCILPSPSWRLDVHSNRKLCKLHRCCRI